MYVARKVLRSSVWPLRAVSILARSTGLSARCVHLQHPVIVTEIRDESSRATPSNPGQISNTTSIRDVGPVAQDNVPAALPVSPLMDTAFLTARSRWRESKASPSKERTLFQRQLARNPYAQALASPVRMCAVTRTWLPSFFLQDFELVKHPTTNDPWYVPRSLTADATKEASALEMAHGTPAKADNARSTDPGPTSIGPKAYILSRHDLITALNTKHSGFHLKYSRFASPRSRQWKAFNDMEKKSKFRKDMDALVLELMRRRVVERLKYLHDREKGYLVACTAFGADVWKDVGSKPYVGAVLWLGSTEGSATVGLSEFTTADWERQVRSKTPVHDLGRLLGPKHMRVLEGLGSMFTTTNAIVLRAKTITVDLQLKLWKLQGYLATHSEHM